VLDFTSALYLGFEHASSSLPAWRKLTLGKPSALAEMKGTADIERQLAELVGCEAASLGTSTLHLFWDLFGMLAAPGRVIFVDQASYPIARWGVERAAAAGAIVRSFPHHAAGALQSALMSQQTGRPLIVTDGFCPGCGRTAPLADYAACAAAKGGLVVLDDTQALGIFGRSPDKSPPYGSGGGGSLRRLAIEPDHFVVVSSLAKAFGVPVAMLGGPRRVVEMFRKRSATRMHCSPPSAAALAAAWQALRTNQHRGDMLRRRLAQRVARFRLGLRQLELLAIPGLFPVQPLRLPVGTPASAIYQALMRRGIRALLQVATSEVPSRLSFAFTVQHRLSDIGAVSEVLAKVVPQYTQAPSESSSSAERL
jgi:8-amino-7-oxononanoate synthase